LNASRSPSNSFKVSRETFTVVSAPLTVRMHASMRDKSLLADGRVNSGSTNPPDWGRRILRPHLRFEWSRNYAVFVKCSGSRVFRNSILTRYLSQSDGRRRAENPTTGFPRSEWRPSGGRRPPSANPGPCRLPGLVRPGLLTRAHSVWVARTRGYDLNLANSIPAPYRW